MFQCIHGNAHSLWLLLRTLSWAKAGADQQEAGALALLRDDGNMDYGGSSMMERGVEHSILFYQGQSAWCVLIATDLIKIKVLISALSLPVHEDSGKD